MGNVLSSDVKKVTTTQFAVMKEQKEKITMLTAYDYTMASLIDSAGIDCILIGDSASNVMAGNSTTLPITMDQMIYHCQSVSRAVKRALVLCDMPFGSYQANADEGIRNAVRLLKEGGADAVKIEGGQEIAEMIRRMVVAGIPVCGHLGLTPQSIHKFGGYGLRAKSTAEAQKLIHDAEHLQNAGCFAIVLEKIPADLAREVSEQLSIPTIGIGAGNGTDGQVLVGADMLGMNDGFSPKFLRRYANLKETIDDAVKKYISDVKTGDFPSLEESY